jgi:hypothetical protein
MARNKGRLSCSGSLGLEYQVHCLAGTLHAFPSRAQPSPRVSQSTRCVIRRQLGETCFPPKSLPTEICIGAFPNKGIKFLSLHRILPVVTIANSDVSQHGKRCPSFPSGEWQSRSYRYRGPECAQAVRDQKRSTDLLQLQACGACGVLCHARKASRNGMSNVNAVVGPHVGLLLLVIHHPL